jgi:hypothetical protein
MDPSDWIWRLVVVLVLVMELMRKKPHMVCSGATIYSNKKVCCCAWLGLQQPLLLLPLADHGGEGRG